MKHASCPEQLTLAAILVLAAALRVTGLTWGLPNELHYFSYHPDESVVLMHSLPAFGGMDILRGQFVPHFYNYGTLQLILIAFACVIGTGYHLIGPISNALGAIDPQAMAHAYLAARSVTVGMGIGTVWATYALGRRLWGHAVGLGAAGALAMLPLHVQHSHFATVDVPATFWVTLSLLWAVKILDNPKAVRPFVVCGLLAGLATATKYNCALVLLGLLTAGHIAAWTRCAGWSATNVAQALGRTALGLAVALLAFVAGCPGALFDRAKFLADIHFEQVHVYQHPEPAFQQTGFGFWYIVVHNLSAGASWPLLIVMLGGIGYALYRRERGDGILGLFALGYFVLISLAASRYARYEIPMLPILALWAARPLAERKPLLLWGCIMLSAAFTVPVLWPMVHEDSRDKIERALIAAPPRSIALASTPWFWTPPLNPYFSLPQPWAWARFPAISRPACPLFVSPPDHPFDVNMLLHDRPDIVLLSELEYHDELRLHDVGTIAYCRYLRANYRIEEGRLSGFPARIDGLPYTDEPIDMLYTNPIALVCYRK